MVDGILFVLGGGDETRDVNITSPSALPRAEGSLNEASAVLQLRTDGIPCFVKFGTRIEEILS